MLVRYIGCRRWEDALQKWCWAFVMLVTSTTVTIAADAPCWEIYRNTTSGPAGSILLNKCTGQTWLLLQGGSAGAWYPISVERTQLPVPSSTDRGR
jgi:hypothetical protein